MAEPETPEESVKIEVKSINFIATWSWNIIADNCAICRNGVQDYCIECQSADASDQKNCGLAWGTCNVSGLYIH